MCWWFGFEVPLQCLSSGSGGKEYSRFFAESRTVFIPKTSDTDDLGRIIRSPDALRSLTLCNCDCKFLTSSICRSLHWYTMRCIHTSQRCISFRQMTDYIFETESTALAHVACPPRDSGVLLTDFAASYPSVNHSWIFSVLEHTGLPDFLCHFLRSIFWESITHVEFVGAKRGQFFHVQRSMTKLSCEWLSVCNGLSPDFPMAPRIWCPKERRQFVVLTTSTMCLRRWSRYCLLMLSRTDGGACTSFPINRLRCWPQPGLS